ncbi:MAG: lamin tail domain-containing protein [Planctomycetota bacterium]|nr:lamin tail domain-containing protein [Planctomycetota bacterium]
MKSIWIRVLGTALGILALSGFFGAPAYGQSLRIYHIDVEQADATLIVSPSGTSLLVDSGKNGHGSRLKAIMDQAGVTQIDFFVCTHYHEDHYGGIDDLVNDEGITVVNAFDRGEKDQLSDTKRSQVTFVDYENAVGNRAVHLVRGDTIPLDDPRTTVTCIASGGIVIGEDSPVVGDSENDKSIALLIEFQGFRYVIGGDIEVTTEGKIATSDLALDVDIYQANHHGSHTSSSLAFLTDLQPRVVIISNGNHGGFQHPRQHTLDTLAGLSPAPTVFQTNKYHKGGLGGNVPDEFIADLESTDRDGTILVTVTVTPSTRQYVVSYTDEARPFPIKPRIDVPVTIVIESLLPDPEKNDRIFESVTLKNKSDDSVSLSSWTLRDKGGKSWSLVSLGDIGPGESKRIVRNGMPMSLNNKGDTITLFGPGNQKRDTFTYPNSRKGVSISTGH